MIAALVLGWAVFVKREVVAPVQAPVVNNNDIISNGVEDDDVLDDMDNSVDDNDISEIDISNWKTYQNEEFGFEVKYPSILYFFDCSEFFYPHSLYICLTPYIKDNCNAPWKAKASVISISTVKDFNKDNIINFLDKNIKEENIIIGNKSAIQISGEREVMGDEGERIFSPSHPVREMIYTIIPFENNISIKIAYSRIISVNNDVSGFYVGEDLSEIYKKLLSIFKFVK